MYLLRALIGSLDCLRLLWLVRIITLALILRHSNKNGSNLCRCFVSLDINFASHYLSPSRCCINGYTGYIILGGLYLQATLTFKFINCDQALFSFRLINHSPRLLAVPFRSVERARKSRKPPRLALLSLARSIVDRRSRICSPARLSSEELLAVYHSTEKHD